MEIQEQKSGTVMTVALKGRLDAITAKAAEEKLLKLIDGGETKLVVDLGGLEYVNSIGLRVFMLCAKRLKAAQGALAVCAMTPPIHKIFEIAGFTSLLKTYPTRDEAVSGIS
jgi:anti-sigma B factor antagonist